MSETLKACTMVATRIGYYGRLLDPGDEFEFKGGPKPSWAEAKVSRAEGGLKPKPVGRPKKAK